MTNLRKIKFEEFIKLQRGFDLPKKDMVDGPYPVVGSTSIIGYHNEYKVNQPGVITGRSGSLGKLQYINKKYWPHNTSLWTKDFKGNNPRYVYYFLHTINFNNFNAGAGVPTLNRNHLDNYDISINEGFDQNKIASILSNYDDLIENNTKRIQLLEKIAKLIYDEWFVKFRFPGHEKVKMVNSELGKIPEGWEVMKLQDCIELAYGKGLKQSDREEGDFLVYGSSGVVGKHNEFLVEGPGIIVGRKGNVGSVFWTFHDFYPIDTVYYVKSEISLYYVYYNFLNQHFLNNDAAVPGLSRKQAYLLPFLKADDITLALFEKQIGPIFKEIERLNGKKIILAKTRDLLLPKLISGQVDVSDLDIKVPEMQEVVV